MKEAMRTKNVLVMTLVIALFIGFVGQSKAQDGVWTSNGPYGGYIPALAVSPNYATDHTAYAGAASGMVYKTTDGGDNWTAMTQINTSDLILALAVSPNYSTDNTVFAGVNSRGVYKTTDGGASWAYVLPSIDIRSIVISPNYATDQTIFAGTSYGVYKSIDGGTNWAAVNSGIDTSKSYIACFLALSPDYANDQTIYAAGWSSTGGVYRSTDGGANWTAVNSGLSDLRIHALTISPGFSSDQTVYAGSYTGIYKTTDSGSSWTAVNSGLSDLQIYELTISPGFSSDQTVYAGTRNGLYKTTDGGTGWTAVNSGISGTPLNITSLAISPDYMTDQTVFTGLAAGGVFKTTSGGSSWAANNTGISSASISSLVISAGYSDDHTIFAGSYNNGVYRTTDGGLSWTSINSGISDFNIYSLVISPNYEVDETVFAGSWGGGVYKTTDGGANWAAVNTGITNNEISSLAISPNYATDQTVFAGLYYGRAVCKTTDGGASWTAVLTGSSAVFSLAISPNYASDLTVYAGTGAGVFKTTDGGTSWTAVNSGIPIKTISALAVSSDYVMDQTVYAGTSNNGLYKTTDRGASWVYSGPGGTIHSIAVSPNYATDHTVYVGTGSGSPHGGGISQGIFKSTDGGASWTTMNSGLPTNLRSGSPTISISPDFATDQTVFAGTNGFSVYSYILSVNSPPVVSDIPDQTINEGESFATIALDDYVDDPDNTDAQMVWTHSGNVELTVSISAARVATIGIPNPDWSGSETITFIATDPGPLSDSDAATFTVNPVNDAPVADDQSVITDEDTLVDITLTASDVDGDPLTYIIVDGPAHGTLSGTAPNVTYTPAENYHGLDSFTFKANDGAMDSDIATVTITVNPVNDDPVAVDDDAVTDEDTAVTVNVLVNDSDVDGDSLTIASVAQGMHGLVSNNVTNVTYTPDADYCGSDLFAYTVSDGNGGADTAIVDVVVTCVNDDPVATDDSTTTDEDAAVTIGVLSNDSDVDGDTLTIASVTQGTNGSVTNNGTDVTYTPDADYCGSDSFTYTVSDGNSGTDTATVDVTVACVNDGPLAVDDTATTDEDTAVTIDVLANDSDVDGDSLTVDSVTQGTNASVTNNGTDVTYIPDADFCGSDSFTYTVSDGNGGTDTATVNVTVACVNDAPVAEDDTYGVDEDDTLTVAAPGVLDNDSDVDGDPLTAVLVTDVSNGTLSLNSDGSFTYTADPDFNGTDSFTYKANDGTNDSNIATVTITVSPVNDAPVANNDSATTDEDTAVTIDVLANDTDVDGDTLTVASVTQPSNGSVTNNSTDVTYTPDADYCGSDSFTYTVSDGNGGMDTATVDVTVTCVNDAPVAEDDAYSVDEDDNLTVAAPGVLGNDNDVEGDTLTAVLVTGTGDGALTLNADGSFTYAPNPDFNGTDTFTYKASDGTDDSNIATVTITVNPVADAPVTADDTYGVDEDDTLTVAAPGVLTNDSDADGDTLTAILVSGPSDGTLTLNAVGSFTYTPDPNFNGTDSFTYRANDGSLDSNEATVTITVNPVNDAPVAGDDSAATDEDTPVIIDVLANDTDVDGDTLTVGSITQGTNGLVTNNGADVTYTPDADYCGDDSFTYTASDGSGGTDTAAVNVSISCVNDAPVAADDAYSVDEDNTLDIAAPGVLTNDSDVEVDPLTAALVSGPSNGTLTLSDDGSFTYTPAPNFNSTDSFTYKANDGIATGNTATVIITVNPVNDAPVAVDDTASTDEDVPVTIYVLANDSDVDGDTLTVISATDGANGTVTILDGSVRYSPNDGFAGEDSFTYTISDGNGGTATATVAVTVIPANKPPTASAGGPYSGDEGSAIVLSGASASDPDNDPLTISWGVDSALCSFDDATALKPTLTCDDNGSYIVTLTVDDGVNDPVSSSADVTVNNVAPSIDAITAPVAPVNINDQPVSVEVTFSDPGTADTHDVTWVWDDVSSDTQYGATSPASQAHTYTEAGVYVVTVTVTDDDGGSATQAYEFIVIYDPEGGFVTGGGWINSPAGAYAPDPSLTGKANFGFVSKYKKGADTPTGETEFQFKAGDLNFHSDSYDWLVVAGPKAKYKGVGTINGGGNYGFMLSAVDEKLTPSTDVDLFRIKIWDKDDGDVIVYDNQMGAEDDADPTTAIGGGSIVIHKE